MVQMSELLPGATTQSEGPFSTGDFSAQEKLLVSMSLLLPWYKVSFRSRALLPVHIWGVKNSLERPRTPRPAGAVLALCMWSLPLRVLPPPGTARGDAAVGSLSLPPSLLPISFFMKPQPLPTVPTPHLLCSLSPCPSINISFPRCQTDVAFVLSPATVRPSQEPG